MDRKAYTSLLNPWDSCMRVCWNLLSFEPFESKERFCNDVLFHVMGAIFHRRVINFNQIPTSMPVFGPST